ncbi:MAG: hypothetical protein EZS28_010159 [Streblomastix strix]|uniref:Uncharacterized protein n=1 Tax=Streblomastix strix TaxID=222440 RepID=A0A5J4WGX0_9EUKA|nr:MAG: hypothetical protein EZS28_010159 [Streblomastix strix]
MVIQFIVINNKATPQNYNVIGGQTGLGENRFLQILSETSTIPDVQQFLGTNKGTFAIQDNIRFLCTNEYAFSYKTFRRALFVKRLPQVATIIDPDRTEEDNTENGLIPSSLGPCKIRSFCFELHQDIVLLENGDVFAFGQLQEFQGWPNVPEYGFIELTDSNGPFGIFETFHVVKYYANAKASITSDGIVLARSYWEVEKKYKYSFTLIDTKFFGGHVNITRGLNKEVKEFAIELTPPQYVIQVPFDASELNTLILTKKTHHTALNKDGKILSIRYEDGSA